jgi:hypothetical protein
VPPLDSHPDPAARLLLAVGLACVVAGGLVAAVTSPLGLDHGSWLAAYLVLVGGVGQGAMGAARLVTGRPAGGSTRGWAQLTAWNGGNALVVAGTLAARPLVVDAGGLACVAALGLALVHARHLRGSWSTWAYRAVLAVLLVSVPVGLVLAHVRAA